MTQIIIGAFPNHDRANQAVTDLQDAGYNPKDISVIVKDSESETVETSSSNAGSSIASGATKGGIIGAIAGLLIGIGAIAIPGIGGVLIAGPIAAALGLSGVAATTVSGALTGGLVGALVRIGIPEETAKIYETRLKEGAVLIAVQAESDDKIREIKDILNNNNAEQVNQFEM